MLRCQRASSEVGKSRRTWTPRLSRAARPPRSQPGGESMFCNSQPAGSAQLARQHASANAMLSTASAARRRCANAMLRRIRLCSEFRMSARLTVRPATAFAGYAPPRRRSRRAFWRRPARLPGRRGPRTPAPPTVRSRPGGRPRAARWPPLRPPPKARQRAAALEVHRYTADHVVRPAGPKFVAVMSRSNSAKTAAMPGNAGGPSPDRGD